MSPLHRRPRHLLRARLASTLLLGGLFLIPVRAEAAMPLAESLSGDAKSSFDAGNLLYENHDYEGAATKYRAAYTSSHDARLLWNMATCEKELRHYARTAALVERFLRDAKPLVSPEFANQAKATLDALRAFYSPVTMVVLPAGAHVLVDGVDVGEAPFAAPVPVDLGKHVVRAEREGFAPLEKPIEVAGQVPMSLELTLKAAAGAASEATLSVSPSEPRDVVSVDDRVMGGGRWSGPLSPGMHRVKVTADGKRPYVLEVDLKPGERRSVDVTLEDEKKKAALWPWVAGGAAVVAGGIVASYFIFKPSDTVGPPPAGQLGTVFVKSFRP
jgi:hypothetical protein